MISAITLNLERGVKLLKTISDEHYSNATIAPYYSSIGSHMRHILDVFDCVFEGLPTSKVDLSARKRNEIIELKISEGLLYFDRIITQLNDLKSSDFEQVIAVVDDLGLGRIEQNYTLGSLLIQVHSHAIHHFASLGYIISQLGIEIPDSDFGLNPTTPKKEILETPIITSKPSIEESTDLLEDEKNIVDSTENIEDSKDSKDSIDAPSENSESELASFGSNLAFLSVPNSTVSLKSTDLTFFPSLRLSQSS